MKTTGFDRLILCQPKEFPSEQANKMATHGLGIIQNAQVVQNLDMCLNQMDLVFACSKRPRDLQIDHYHPRAAAGFIKGALNKDHQVALLFGNETSGLSNETIERAHAVIEIPMYDFNDSLNLSHAVQVILYEVFITPDNHVSIPQNQMPEADEKICFESHFQQILQRKGLIKHNSTWPKIRCMLRRLRPDRRELQLLFGLLTSENPVEKK
jgi:tRNA (cytidine32/uridine32-2'-O)-methyltransferase